MVAHAVYPTVDAQGYIPSDNRAFVMLPKTSLCSAKHLQRHTGQSRHHQTSAPQGVVDT